MADNRFDRFLPLSGVLVGLLFFVGLCLNRSDPSSETGPAETFSYWQADHGQHQIVGLLVAPLIAFLLLFFGAGLKRRLEQDSGGSSYGSVAFGGAVLAAAVFTLVAMLEGAMANAAHEGERQAVYTINQIHSYDWLGWNAAFAGMLLATGLGARRNGMLPTPFVWATIVIGGSLLTPAGFFGFILLPVWLIVVGLWLSRHKTAHPNRPQTDHKPASQHLERNITVPSPTQKRTLMMWLALAALLLPATAAARSDATIVPLHISGRVLRTHELPGFAPKERAATVTSVAAWNKVAPSGGIDVASRLLRAGFVAAVREDLSWTSGRDGAALSAVVRLGSAKAARAEIAQQVRDWADQLNRGDVKTYTPFVVPGIPGAHGWTGTSSDGRNRGYNIIFADGPFTYHLGVGWGTQVNDPPTRAQLITATATLYKRVHGRPAP